MKIVKDSIDWGYKNFLLSYKEYTNCDLVSSKHNYNEDFQVKFECTLHQFLDLYMSWDIIHSITEITHRNYLPREFDFTNKTFNEGEIVFILPEWFSDETYEKISNKVLSNSEINEIRNYISENERLWLENMIRVEETYFQLIKNGVSEIQSFSILPACLKRDVILTFDRGTEDFNAFVKCYLEREVEYLPLQSLFSIYTSSSNNKQKPNDIKVESLKNKKEEKINSIEQLKRASYENKKEEKLSPIEQLKRASLSLNNN